MLFYHDDGLDGDSESDEDDDFEEDNLNILKNMARLHDILGMFSCFFAS